MYASYLWEMLLLLLLRCLPSDLAQHTEIERVMTLLISFQRLFTFAPPVSRLRGGEKVNARTEQLRDQIEKSAKSERRGLKAREDTMRVDGSLSSRDTAAPSHEISRCGAVDTGTVPRLPPFAVHGRERATMKEKKKRKGAAHVSTAR